MAGEYGENRSVERPRRLLRGDESDDMIDGTGSGVPVSGPRKQTQVSLFRPGAIEGLVHDPLLSFKASIVVRPVSAAAVV